MSDSVCAKCGADAVEFDMVAGLSACQECGAVQSEELLVHGQQFDEGSGAAVGTTYVAAADTGKWGGCTLHRLVECIKQQV